VFSLRHWCRPNALVQHGGVSPLSFLYQVFGTTRLTAGSTGLVHAVHYTACTFCPLQSNTRNTLACPSAGLVCGERPRPAAGRPAAVRKRGGGGGASKPDAAFPLLARGGAALPRTGVADGGRRQISPRRHRGGECSGAASCQLAWRVAAGCALRQHARKHGAAAPPSSCAAQRAAPHVRQQTFFGRHCRTRSSMTRRR